MKKGLEEQSKQEVFNKICRFIEENQKILSNTKAIKGDLGIDAEINNIVHTAIAKVMGEIEPQFRSAGLNFYSDSIVAQSISNQIIAYVNKGHKMLVDYEYSIKEFESPMGIRSTLRLPRLFGRFLINIEKKFIHKKKNISPEALQIARQHMGEYISLEKELSEYNLRDAIIPAILSTICPDDDIMYLHNAVETLLAEDIRPTLIRLGFADLIPKLEQAIEAKYKKEYCGEIYSSPEPGMPELKETKKEERPEGFEPGDD